MTAIAIEPGRLNKAIAWLSADEQAEFDRLVADDSRPLPDVEYQRDPVGWATKVLHIPENTIRWSLNPEYVDHQWDGTPDPLATMAEALANGQNVGVESGVNTGKTFTDSWLGLWFLACFENALVVTTAPIKDQLTLQLWQELGKHWGRFKKAYPKAETVELRVRLKPNSAEKESWAMIGYACGVDAASASAVRAQGFHRAHMLIITEETPGIDPAIMAALRGTQGGEHNLQLSVGNPDNMLDTLHQYCVKPDVIHIRISSLDFPNIVCGRDVIPGAQSRKGLTQLVNDWGLNSPMYGSRVRGISPAESVDALIKLEWCVEAAKRWELSSKRTGRYAKGVDVAQSVNGDKAAIATWNGACLESVRSFQCTNATELGTNVYGEMQELGIDPENVGVDPIGPGVATMNELRRLTVTGVQGLNGGATPVNGDMRAEDGSTYEWVPDAGLFHNLRSQMQWQMREDLRLQRVDIPDNPELIRQLTTPTYDRRNGKIIVESKETLKKRLGGQSPDDADAVIYGNWVRPRDEMFSQDVQIAYEGRDHTEFPWNDTPIDEDYGTGSGTLSQFGVGF